MLASSDTRCRACMCHKHPVPGSCTATLPGRAQCNTAPVSQKAAGSTNADVSGSKVALWASPWPHKHARTQSCSSACARAPYTVCMCWWCRGHSGQWEMSRAYTLPGPALRSPRSAVGRPLLSPHRATSAASPSNHQQQPHPSGIRWWSNSVMLVLPAPRTGQSSCPSPPLLCIWTVPSFVSSATDCYKYKYVHPNCLPNTSSSQASLTMQPGTHHQQCTLQCTAHPPHTALHPCLSDTGGRRQQLQGAQLCY
jgi:hypothetical protein